MKEFSIRDIENLCGIKAHTLRIWEQRYDFIKPGRKHGNHRIYDSEDLKSILSISFLYHQGYKISKIAALTPDKIRLMVEDSYGKDINNELYIHELIGAGVDLDKDKFEKVTNTIVLMYGIEKCITGIFIPFLERIGMLWMTNNIIPAQEHFASHIIRKKIICATDGLEDSVADAPSVVIFAPTGEMHEIPLLIANYIFRKNGFRTIYFGINTPAECLYKYLSAHPADYLYTHIISQMNKTGNEDFLCKLSALHKGQPILASGNCVKCMCDPGGSLRIIHSIEELTDFAREKAAISAKHSSLHPQL